MADSDLLPELQEIRKHLERMDKRDRLRTIGGFIRSLLNIIPLLFLLYGSWYLINHGDEVIANIATVAAEKATQFTQGQLDGIKDQMGQQGIQTLDMGQLLEMFKRGGASSAAASVSSEMSSSVSSQ